MNNETIIMPIATKVKREEGIAFYVPKYRLTIISTVNEKEPIKDLTESISHETLHYVIHKIAGVRATMAFDKIQTKLIKKSKFLAYGCVNIRRE